MYHTFATFALYFDLFLRFWPKYWPLRDRSSHSNDFYTRIMNAVKLTLVAVMSDGQVMK